MAVRQIRLFGDPVLRTPAEPVRDYGTELRTLVRDLAETMTDADGAGLAAPQIGVGLRVFVFRYGEYGEEIGHLVNPVLGEFSAEQEEAPEGCLSIPGLAFPTRRAQRVVATGRTADGEPITVTGDDRVARALQHETDHLDGVLFIDRLDPEQRRAAMRAIRDAEWSGLAAPVIRASPHPVSPVRGVR